MKRVKFIVPILLLLFLVSCAGIQAQWDALSPADQAKILLNSAQDQLTDNFRIGKDYVAKRPQYQDVWKNEINPAFDLANKSIKAGLNLASAGKITPTIFYKETWPLVNAVLSKLVAIGAIKP